VSEKEQLAQKFLLQKPFEAQSPSGYRDMAVMRLYDFGSTFGSNGNRAFDNDRTKQSKDGSLLFATIANGVGYVLTK
jgi:hypothetical protein